MVNLNMNDEIIKKVKIEELNLEKRTYNSLKRAGIKTVGEIINLSFKDLKEIRNLGNKCFEDIVDKIHSLNLLFKDELLNNNLSENDKILQIESFIEKINEEKYNEVKVSDLFFSTNTCKYLLENDIKTLYDLILIPEYLLKKIDGININQINEKLDLLGITDLNRDKLVYKKYLEKVNEKKFNQITVEQLCFSVRTYNSLKRSNINTLEDILNLKESELMKIHNFGKKNFDEVSRKIGMFGLTVKNNLDKSKILKPIFNKDEFSNGDVDNKIIVDNETLELLNELSKLLKEHRALSVELLYLDNEIKNVCEKVKLKGFKI